MGLVSLKAWRQRSAAHAEARARLKTRILEALRLGPGDAVAVNEIACADPGCPDRETVVLVMRPGEPTRAFRFERPVEAIDAHDLSAIIAQIRAGLPAPPG